MQVLLKASGFSQIMVMLFVLSGTFTQISWGETFIPWQVYFSGKRMLFSNEGLISSRASRDRTLSKTAIPNRVKIFTGNRKKNLI